jgi:hypothetical protein
MDDATANKGLINASYVWYEPLKNSFYKVARDIYGLRQFMTGLSTGIEKNKSVEKLSVWPNPTTGRLSVLASAGVRTSEIEVYSINGNRVSQYRDVDLPFTFEMAACPPGVYIVRVMADGILYSGSILKN